MSILTILLLIIVWVLIGAIFPPVENKVWFFIWIIPLVLVAIHLLGTTAGWIFGLYLVYRLVKLLISNI